jgi:hypothetical protein
MHVQRSEFVGFDNIPYKQSSLGQFMGLSIYNLSGKTHMVGSKFFNFSVKIVQSMQIINPKRKGFIHSKHKSRQKRLLLRTVFWVLVFSLSLSLSLWWY